MGRVKFGANRIVRFASAFHVTFFMLLQEVQAALDLVRIVFERFKGLHDQGILGVDPRERRCIRLEMVEIRIDDHIHGEIQGETAVISLELTSPQEVEGDDVQDFMLHRAFHLFRGEREEHIGIEIHDVLGVFEIDPCRTSQVKANVAAHLKEKVAKEIVLIFHEP